MFFKGCCVSDDQANDHMITFYKKDWWARQDLNPRQHRYERCVLTAELQARRSKYG